MKNIKSVVENENSSTEEDNQVQFDEMASEINKYLVEYKYEINNITIVSNKISIKSLSAKITSDIEEEKASISGVPIIGFLMVLTLAVINNILSSQAISDFSETSVLLDIAINLIKWIFFITILGVLMILFKGYKKYVLKIKELTHLKELITIYSEHK